MTTRYAQGRAAANGSAVVRYRRRIRSPRRRPSLGPSILCRGGAAGCRSRRVIGSRSWSCRWGVQTFRFHGTRSAGSLRSVNGSESLQPARSADRGRLCGDSVNPGVNKGPSRLDLEPILGMFTPTCGINSAVECQLPNLRHGAETVLLSATIQGPSDSTRFRVSPVVAPKV